MTPATAWIFLVFALGVHNGHQFVGRTVVDRIVLPTREACEAARRGVGEAQEEGAAALFEAGPCEPVTREDREQPAPPAPSGMC